jgi:hypothetical protein
MRRLKIFTCQPLYCYRSRLDCDLLKQLLLAGGRNYNFLLASHY